MNGGSFFLAEIRRMVSSFRPRGMTSDSMSVTNPYLYSPVVSVSRVVLTGSPLVVPRAVVELVVGFPSSSTPSRLHGQWRRRPRPLVTQGYRNEARAARRLVGRA